MLRIIVVTLGITSTTTASAVQDQSRSAFFCQGESGPRRNQAFAAIREIPGGDVQFAISKWQENGHHFGLTGIAQRDGERWVYKERARKWIYHSDDARFYYADTEPNALPTCQVTIEWPRLKQVSILVDEKIGCDDHHGRAFGWLSSQFLDADYNGDVRREFDDTDRFFNRPRCDEPGAHHGAVQVVD